MPTKGRPRTYLPADSRIPTAAPERWRGSRSQGETLADFFRRVWGPFLPLGLQAVQLRRLDAALWKALYQHIVRYALPWPADLELPGLRPRQPSIIAKLDQGRWQELTDDDIIAALIMRQREQAAQKLQALRQQKRELRKRKIAVTKELRLAARAPKREGPPS